MVGFPVFRWKDQARRSPNNILQGEGYGGIGGGFDVLVMLGCDA